MNKYQIVATIEKITLQDKTLKLVLKGVENYLYMPTDPKKQLNILENLENVEESKFFKPDNEFSINLQNDIISLQLLLGHAFAERKKLKFYFDDEYKIIEITHVFV